jgi:hypothetical protein
VAAVAPRTFGIYPIHPLAMYLVKHIFPPDGHSAAFIALTTCLPRNGYLAPDENPAPGGRLRPPSLNCPCLTTEHTEATEKIIKMSLRAERGNLVTPALPTTDYGLPATALVATDNRFFSAGYDPKDHFSGASKMVEPKQIEKFEGPTPEP